MRSVRRIFLVASSLAFGASLAAQVLPGTKTPSRPQTYGNSAVSYLRVSAVEFLPASDSVTYATPFQARFSTGACSGCFRAPVHLPAGAKLVYLELDFIDTNPGTYVDGGLFECDYAGYNCLSHPLAGAGPPDCLVPQSICSGSAFAAGEGAQSADLTPDNLVVDNQDKSYVLQADNYSFDVTTEIGGMLIGYVLQVSAAPVTATFSDVPPIHPFFKFVEALVAAGITAGYGDGTFGVGDPITRGQMAVFLSVALGLQFP